MGAPEYLEERVSGVAWTRTQIHDDRYCETRRGPKDGAERGTEEGEEGLEERTGRILTIPHSLSYVRTIDVSSFVLRPVGAGGSSALHMFVVFPSAP